MVRVLQDGFTDFSDGVVIERGRGGWMNWRGVMGMEVGGAE